MRSADIRKVNVLGWDEVFENLMGVSPFDKVENEEVEE